MSTYKQSSCRGYLIILLSISFALIGCTAANTRIASAGLLTTWIQQNAIPLKTVEPGGSDADLQPLQSLVGNASIVGLGEETHGTHEFFTMKARLVEFLVSRMGFNTFIMENNWGASRLIDAYINGGQGNVEDVMRMSLFFSWQTQEYRDMLEWMRAYNTDAAHTTKIHFIGMDCQGVSQGEFDEVENYVHAVDPQQAAHIQNLYADIIARASRAGTPSTHSWQRKRSSNTRTRHSRSMISCMLTSRHMQTAPRHRRLPSRCKTRVSSYNSRRMPTKTPRMSL